jgi:hypothetical protein
MVELLSSLTFQGPLDIFRVVHGALQFIWTRPIINSDDEGLELGKGIVGGFAIGRDRGELRGYGHIVSGGRGGKHVVNR